MIPAVFSVAGITLVVGQQIPAEFLQPKVTGTASCWAEPNRAPRTTQDHPEVHQHAALPPRVQEVQTEGGRAASSQRNIWVIRTTTLWRLCSGHYKTRSPGESGLFSVPNQDPTAGEAEVNSSVNKHPSVDQAKARVL